MSKVYRWKVSEVPVGLYHSFTHRAWPTAEYPHERIAAQILCQDRYELATAKTGDHAPLTLWIADYSVTPWQWKKINRRFARLQDVKDTFDRLIKQNQHFIPSDF